MIVIELILHAIGVAVAWYLDNWAWALVHIGDPRGLGEAVCLILLPVALWYTGDKAVWLLADSFTGGGVFDYEAQRANARRRR